MSRRAMVLLLAALAASLPAAAAAAAGAPRRALRQAFTDATYVAGTNVRTSSRFSRLSSDDAQALVQQDAQNAARAGDTTFLTSAAATYTAGRTQRGVLAGLAADDVAGAIRGGGGARAAAAMASDGAQMWSSNEGGLTNSVGTRASLARDQTAAAVRASLDNPSDVFRATATGQNQASGVAWPNSYASWV
ncbi:hypothetical protein Rsub_03069 [Raphidocelis subcapitata]|uniref:Uncharacterized protein n=1 Tax=Raphidocelis subcapitata TaxID=307507 RepID=A0A2V0NSW4_9CHLO|nr:hypothetical protein Rsub_03069 [Raphidocelis subcapitata]|eukprot:GBF90768.1 hypothetical protein Rsub_03069 [Raphidocelis subcapitata]